MPGLPPGEIKASQGWFPQEAVREILDPGPSPWLIYIFRCPVIEQGNKKPRGQRWKESPEDEPARKKRSRHVTKILDPDPDPPSPESPTETFAAPAEVRHFTDGSFPPGFVLQLFSHTQLRTTDSKNSSKDSKAAEGLPQPQSPSSGEPSWEGLVRKLSPWITARAQIEMLGD